MELKTRDFGIVTIEEDAVFRFPEGIYGFEDCKEFAVFQQKFDDISLLYLQSTADTYPCFLIFEPWDMHPDYQPRLSPEDMAACQVSDIEELMFLSIATLPGSSFVELSINIKSPVVLNPKTRCGRQVILQNSEYPVRYQPFLENRPTERKDG